MIVLLFSLAVGSIVCDVPCMKLLSVTDLWSTYHSVHILYIYYGQRVTRGLKNLHLKSVNTDYGRNATRFQGALGWNRLAGGLKGIKSTNAFRSRLKLHFLTEQ